MIFGIKAYIAVRNHFLTKTNQTMNALLGIGKYLFAIPFLVFGVFHFMGAEAMAGMA